jgi:RNA polymerase sigma-70 factor (ECF subfamily)
MRHLFGRYRVSVYRFVRRILRRDDLVDDVVADVFFEVWKRAGAFEGRSTVITWILGIARFKALSALRQRSYAALDDATIENTVDPADDPAAAFERDDTASALRSAIAALAPLHAEVVDLIYYHGRTLGEVAEILGIPENTVKTRVFAARKKLAEMLAARGIDRL